VTQYMLDLETYSTQPTAAIVQIGVCDVNSDRTLLINVDAATCWCWGLSCDASTLDWWSQQGVAAQQSLSTPAPIPLPDALRVLADWLGLTDEAHEIWALPASFDLPILANAYAAVGLPVPWHYRSARCLRTLRSILPRVDVPAPTLKHNALADALSQAAELRALTRLVQALVVK
jgi:hypothetical protein